jgi:hypothetical protein
MIGADILNKKPQTAGKIGLPVWWLGKLSG